MAYSLFSKILTNDVNELKRDLQTVGDANAVEEYVNTYNQHGITPLNYAIEKNASVSILQILLEAGANPSKPNRRDGNTALYSAVMMDSPKQVVDLLIGSDSDIPGLNQGNPLRENTERVILYLIDNSVKPSKFRNIIEGYELDIYENSEPSMEEYVIPSPIEKEIHPSLWDMGTIESRDLYYVQLIHEEYIDSLTPHDKHIVKQYSFHGDVIINSFLRGVDTLDVYFNNIPKIKMIMKDKKDKTKNDLFFLFYYTMFDMGIIERMPRMVKTFYMKEILPIVQRYTLDDFRLLSYNYFKSLYNIIRSCPRHEKPFHVYRGTKTHYLKTVPDLNADPMPVFYLSTFHSTSYTRPIANRFGDIMYNIYVHPDAYYMFNESVSIDRNENELIIAPYARYVYIGTSGRGNEHHYVVLPCDIQIPNDYATYDAWRRPHVGGRVNVTRRNGNLLKHNRNVAHKNVHVNTRQNKTSRNNKNTKKPNSRLSMPQQIFRHRASTAEEKSVALSLYKAFHRK